MTLVGATFHLFGWRVFPTPLHLLEERSETAEPLYDPFIQVSIVPKGNVLGLGPCYFHGPFHPHEWVVFMSWGTDTVMDGSMNHPKWNRIVTYVALYFVSCILIWFTDTHLKSVPQLFQNKPQAFTWARCKMVLTTSFEPKPVNESHAKNGGKCVFSVLVLSFCIGSGTLGHAESTWKIPQMHWSTVKFHTATQISLNRHA